jgi:hypothetical protein
MYILIVIMLHGGSNFLGEFNSRENCIEALAIIKNSNNSKDEYYCLKK